MMLQHHQAQLSQTTISTDVILSIIQESNLDHIDIEAIMESHEAIPWKYRKHAQQIFVSKEFYGWASSSKSCKLLIQGQTGNDSIQARLAIAWVSASLMQTLRMRNHFASLAFFCGRHFEPEDGPIGATIMISSLMAQLLQQHYANTVFNQQDIDIAGLKSGNVSALCIMFEWLVRQLPRDKTLLCVIDAVDAYETEELEVDMRTVLRHLLELTRDTNVSATIKVLASATGTIEVHEEFQDQDANILLMESLTSSLEDAGWESNYDSDD